MMTIEVSFTIVIFFIIQASRIFIFGKNFQPSFSGANKAGAWLRKLWLLGESLKAVWAEFSTLVIGVLSVMRGVGGANTTNMSKVENSAQVSPCYL